MTIKPDQRRLYTIIVGVVVLVAFIVAGMTLRVPYVALGPGPTVNTLGTVQGRDVVQVEGAVDPHPKGHLNLTTVSLHDGLTLFQALGMWASSNYELQPRESYFEPGKSEEQVHQETKAQMSGSEINASTAALNYLHTPTSPGVAAIVVNSAADGRLELNDRIISVGGTPVADAAATAAAVQSHRPGETVDIEVQRGPSRLVVPVKLGESSGKPDEPKKASLGVTVQPMPTDPNMNIKFNVGDIGGPSAGLMLTLAVIDYMTPGDLSRNSFVAGTGTIDPSGKVGEIGGISHKIQAADEAGAKMFLVPAGNCSEATSGAPDDIELVKVSTLTDAVNALETIGTDKPRPHCS